jgi:DNA-binding response OmpR family regulator
MKTQKILIVDDEPMIRWTMKEALKSWGFDPICAENTKAASIIFEAGEPDAVLLDINLPDGSGLDLLRKLKQIRPQIPIVIISGEVIVENTIEALRGGADDFIAKPINLNEVRIVLENKLSPQRSKIPENSFHRQKIMIISDSPEHLKTLRTLVNPSLFEIKAVSTQEDLGRICDESHDLAIIDLNSTQLPDALSKIRGCEDNADIPVLVSLNRIAGDPSITGLLPQYRAMPCSPAELAILMQRRANSLDEMRAAQQIL